MGIAIEVHIFEPLKDAHRPVGPMQLIEVDVIRPESLQTCLDCLPDLRPPGLCRDDERSLRSQSAVPQPAILVATWTLSRFFCRASQVPMMDSVRPWVSRLA